MPHKKIPFITHLTLVLVSIISVGYLLHIGQFIIAPFFLAFLLAFLFLPFVRFLERKFHFPKLLSALMAVLVILILIGGIGFLFGSRIADFGHDIPQLKEQFKSVFNSVQHQIKYEFNINMDQQLAYLNKGLDKLFSSSGAILSGTVSVFSSIFGFFSFCIIFLFFILSYRGVLGQFIINVFSNEHREKVAQVVRGIEKVTKSYLIGICIQIIIVSVLASSALSILGVEYPIVLGIFTGLINIIPYVGIAVSGLLACLFAFVTVSPISILYVIIAYEVIHLIDGNIVLPFIVGSQTKINPLFTFLGILIGAALWGVSGMFLCIPALAIFKIIAQKVAPLKPWGKVLGDGKD